MKKRETHDPKPTKKSSASEELNDLLVKAQAQLKAAVRQMKEERAKKWRKVPDSELATKLAVMNWVLHGYELKYGAGKAPMSPWRMHTMQNDREDIAACELEIKSRAKKAQKARIKAWAECPDCDLPRRLSAAKMELKKLMANSDLAQAAAEMLAIEQTPFERRTPEQVQRYRKFIADNDLAVWKAEAAAAKAEVEVGEAEVAARGIDG